MDGDNPTMMTPSTSSLLGRKTSALGILPTSPTTTPTTASATPPTNLLGLGGAPATGVGNLLGTTPKKPLPSFGDWYTANGKGSTDTATLENQYNRYLDSVNGPLAAGSTDYVGPGEIDAYFTGNAYKTANDALKPAEAADVAEFNRTAPFAQRRLLGGLNARGLGSSVMAGGSGSGALGELSNRQQNQLGSIESGYQGIANNLERGKASDQINMDSFYQQLAQQRAYAQQLQQQSQFDPFQILGLGASAAKALF